MLKNNCLIKCKGGEIISSNIPQSSRVFISYSHDSPQHEKKVLDLSNKLCHDGIDCYIDRYERSPSMGWPLWMHNQIDGADFVLVVCTETYKRRYLRKEEPSKGKGVKWEGAIITQELYESGGENEKYIPIVLSSDNSEFIPTILKGATYYDLDEKNEYNELYSHLTNQNHIVKPKIGEVRLILPIKDETEDELEQEYEMSSLESDMKPDIGPLRTMQISTQDHPAPNTKSNVPYPRNQFFTGREEMLEQIHKDLMSDKAVLLSQSVAICGLGGIGKTQTAIEYTYRFNEEYDFILWVTADSEDSIILNYVSIARLLNLSVKDDSDQKLVVSSVMNWLRTNEDWLLVFDNADNPDIIGNYLPIEYRGHILLTSRSQVFDKFGITTPIEVKKMQLEEAREFFIRRTGHVDLTSSDAAALDELLQELDYLPLAIEQAGAYIHKLKCSFDEYLSSYRKRGLDLLELSPDTTGNYPKSVATTWLLNFEQVEQMSKASADVLFASAFLDCTKIPFMVFVNGGKELGDNISSVFCGSNDDPLIIREVLKPLIQFSLISTTSEKQDFDVHRLVQSVIKANMDKSSQCLWVERIVKAINLVYPEVEFANWSICDQLLSHSLACSELIRTWDMKFSEASELLNSTGLYLQERGRFGECESLFKDGLKISEIVFGLKHSSIAESLNNLGTLYQAQGKYSEAELLLNRALKIREDILDPEHLDVAESLNNLGLLYQAQGKYSEAELLLNRALKIRDYILDPEHLDVAKSLSDLGNLYRNQGRYFEAELLLNRALKIREKILDHQDPNLAVSFNDLAVVYHDQEKYTEVESLYNKALEIRESTLGVDHPDTATFLNNLGSMYRVQGKYSEAEALFNRALKINENIFGPEYPGAAYSFNNLGRLYNDQEKYSEAEQFCMKALELRENILGPEHPEVGHSLNNLAGIYHNQEKYSEAETLYNRALKILENTVGPDHPDIANALNNLGILYERQRNVLKAQNLYSQSIDMMERTKNDDNPKFLKYLENYARVLAKVKNRKASIIAKRVKLIREKKDKGQK
ncbi:tetratricopeptide repeat protein [Methanococcoides seepicolus]|uniref:Tetratricopeptide repeat protein n=1 Tax=Methanococcoides seepicolus TaxID=2828780 RepID=A0A9E5DBH7_9EURY|nr:tetratricopeptide repeat protein [Methanococcoides seepicolus]MCM1986937.1 tetratricopeptide repeat protein [Methanococcoides seepicolus]